MLVSNPGQHIRPNEALPTNSSVGHTKRAGAAKDGVLELQRRGLHYARAVFF